MGAILRPIVGHTTAHTTRLWCHRAAAERVRGVRVRPAGGDARLIDVRPIPTASGTAWLADVEGLLADTDHEYEFVDAQRARLVSGSGGFRTLPEDARVDRLAFLLASCHKIDGHETDFDTWNKLAGRLDRGPRPSFLLMCGDQAYCEDAGPADWRRLDDHELDAAFEACYFESWRHLPVQKIWSQLPTYMMWDDHEIMDDWGSGRKTRRDADLARWYAAAERTYLRFQHAHNPTTAAGKDYGFQVGPAGFYTLDLRSARGDDFLSPVLGKAQLARFDAWLAAHVELEVLFVVSPVPLAHVSQFLLGLTRQLGRSVPLKFDTADQWTFGDNRRDLEALLDRLFAWQNAAPVRQVVVLSGDVHMPTLGRIHSREAAHHRRPTLLQFTSSAISNSMVHPMLQAAVARVLGAADTRRDIELVAGRYHSDNLFFGVHRNFGEVSLQRDLEGGWDLGFELQEETGAPRRLGRFRVRPI